jgi:hypothetical protein
MHCKNCGNVVRDSFCSHCGQKTKVDRITYSYIWREAFHFFTHIERGFIYTSLQMLASPAKTVRNFIEGKRKTYQPPVSYFLVWTTIYILSLYWVDITFGENVVISYGEYFGPEASTKFAISHLSLVLTFVIPFQALYLFLLSGRRYNYFESLVAALYAMGTIILLQFVFVIVALLIHTLSSAAVAIRISDILKAGYLTWFIVDIIKLFPVKAKFVRIVAFAVLSFGTFTLWRLYGVPQFINWILNNH